MSSLDTRIPRSRGLFLLFVLLLAAVSMLCARLVVKARGNRRGGFTEVAASLGIHFLHENGARGKRFMPETTVGGLGWIDYDRDGFPDLFLVNANLHSDRGGDGDTTSRLYRNIAGKSFRDVTAETGAGCRGYGSGVAVGDFDGDGHDDLYVTNLGPNVLLRNGKDHRFEDVTRSAGVAAGGWSSSAAFFDFDLDGDLDLYVCRYVDYDPARECRQGGKPSYCSPHEFPGLPDVLYRNRGDGTFEDVSTAAGVALGGPSEGKSLGVVVLDYDDDGDPDIFVACDQVPNLLFRNNGDGTFREVGLAANVAYGDDGLARAGMGVDAGDVDLDGRSDLVVTNFADEPASLFRNLGGGLFADEGRRFEVAGPTLERLEFGVLLVDHDLDGDLDLYVANGHVLDNIAELRPGRTFAQEDLLLENDDGRRFRDISRASGAWFTRRAVSRGVASCDYDGDGDEDIAVLLNGEGVALLRNDAPVSRWIAFRLVGTRSNRDGFGARVVVRLSRGGEPSSRLFECRSARSYASACDPRITVGLGRGPVDVESVEITWPSGIRQEIQAPAPGKVHTVVEAAR